MFDDELFVLPAQRPASPEMAESPRLTTHGAPTPGPSAAAGDAPLTITPMVAAKTATATAIRTEAMRRRIPHPPVYGSADGSAGTRNDVRCLSRANEGGRR